MGNTRSSNSSAYSHADETDWHSDAAIEQWQAVQRRAQQMRDRLQQSLLRMDLDDPHRHPEWIKQLLEQLQRLAEMQPGTVSMQHFTVRETERGWCLEPNNHLRGQFKLILTRRAVLCF
jgi:hypothetical protein